MITFSNCPHCQAECTKEQVVDGRIRCCSCRKGHTLARPAPLPPPPTALRAKLPAATCIHSWRHTTSTRLNELGITEAVRAAIIGNSNGKNVTQLYTHATLNTMRTALTQLELTILSKLLSRVFSTARRIAPGGAL